MRLRMLGEGEILRFTNIFSAWEGFTQLSEVVPVTPRVELIGQRLSISTVVSPRSNDLLSRFPLKKVVWTPLGDVVIDRYTTTVSLTILIPKG